METKFARINCLQDVVIHHHNTGENGVWIDTYTAFHAGGAYWAEVSFNPINKREYTVAAKNSRGIEHQLKGLHDGEKWFKDNFSFEDARSQW